MAQLLYERQSTDTHLNAARRHMRLCRKFKGAEQYATRIETYHKDLEEKQKVTEKVDISD
jgi:hypothetical protein